jgi:probable rRNA maturation factor
MPLYLENRQTAEALDCELVRRRTESLLERLGLAGRELEVELLDDAAITLLNEKFFSRRRPTNVISFPLDSDSGPFAGEHLGTIAVSVETARRETEELGYTLEEGVLYYLLHGLLHLLGYEHVGVADEVAAAMEKRQDELFALVLAAD